ncbi:MAG: DUF6174 domain-containing protein [Pirellulaceae bacterium]
MSAATSPNANSRAPLFRRVLVGLAAGLVLGLVVMLALAIWNRDPSSARLTPELFHAAKAKWKQAQPQDYNIEIQVRGNQPATYYVEVRGGEAQLALRNGNPLTQRRTFSTWSVPGMFATMSRDVDALERRAAGQANQSTPDLNLRATFDPRYGYPARYRRIQYRSSSEVEWEVTRFKPLPGERGTLAP